jgi:hypothetical protein
MAVKSEYYLLNGATWELHYFKTSADLVVGLQDALDAKQNALGYTPANKAGDTFSGSMSFNGSVFINSGISSDGGSVAFNGLDNVNFGGAMLINVATPTLGHLYSKNLVNKGTYVFNSSSNLLLYMDADSEGGSWQIGDTFTIVKLGSGYVRIYPSGATIYRNINGVAGTGDCYVGGKYAAVSFIKVSTNAWVAIGLMSTTAVY